MKTVLTITLTALTTPAFAGVSIPNRITDAVACELSTTMTLDCVDEFGSPVLKEKFSPGSRLAAIAILRSWGFELKASYTDRLSDSALYFARP